MCDRASGCYSNECNLHLNILDRYRNASYPYYKKMMRDRKCFNYLKPFKSLNRHTFCEEIFVSPPVKTSLAFEKSVWKMKHDRSHAWLCLF